MVARSREAAGRQLAGHRADLFAVCLFVLGAIFALGLWTDLAGPVGSALADGTGAVLGRARVAVPVACFAFGVVLLWPRRSATVDPDADTVDGETDARPEVPTVRIAIGALLLFVADVGILHLAYGRPALDGDLDALRDAGGALGAMVGGPLVAATGVAGASLDPGRGRRRRGPARARPLHRRDRRRHRPRLARRCRQGPRVGEARARSVRASTSTPHRRPPVLRPSTTRSTTRTRRPEPAFAPELVSEPEPEPLPPALPPTTAAAIEIPVAEDPSGQLAHRPRRRRRRAQGSVEAARRQHPEAGERQGSRPPRHRRRRQHPRGHARAPRRRGEARRHHRRPDRHPLRARARRRA